MKFYMLALAATMVPAAASAQMIPENTPVTVRTLEEISSKTAQVGDPVRMETIDDVIVGGVTVIPAGTPAYGEVTAAQKNGHLGHSGKLTIEVEGVRYGAGRMRLRGSRDNQGSGGGTAALATAALVSPLGLLIKGKSAAVPIHTRFMAYVANDTPMMGAVVQPLPGNATSRTRRPR